MAFLRLNVPFSDKSFTLGDDSQDKDPSDEGILSMHWGGGGNQHVLSLLNLAQTQEGGHLSMGSYTNGEETYELAPGDVANNGDTTVAIGSHTEDGTTTSLLQNTMSSNGGLSMDLSALDVQSGDENTSIGNVSFGLVNDQQNGVKTQGYQLDGSLVSHSDENSDFKVGSVSASSVVNESNGQSEMVIDGGAYLAEGSSMSNGETTAWNLPGFGVHGESETGRISLVGGPTLGDVDVTQTAEGGDGIDSSFGAGVHLSEDVGFDLRLGNANDHGGNDYGLMLYGVPGGSSKSNGSKSSQENGDVGIIVSTGDLNGDGNKEPTGLDIGAGYGSLSQSLTDEDHNGVVEYNQNVSVGPVSVDSKMESPGSYLDSLGGWFSNRAENVKSVWSSLWGN